MPTQTPLTDAINALTTYSNTVTGKTPPDTTLSEAVATLAAGYGGGGSYTAPLYPMMGNINNGSLIGYLYVTRKSNCTHVKMEFTANKSAAVWINLTNMATNTNSSNAVNNRPLWFTIPSNKQTVYKIENVVNADGIVFSFGFRLANGTSSATQYSSGDGTWENGKTTTLTLETGVNVGCAWIYIGSSVLANVSGKTLEFDMSFTVDGTLYF